MILYLHGFDATSSGNHDKMRQLQFIDHDVRLVSYSTEHPKHDLQYLLNEVSKHIAGSTDDAPLIIGVGLGAFWAERIGFLKGLKSVLINPNLSPEQSMIGKINRPEEYRDIMHKCVENFRHLNRGNALCILARNDEITNSAETACCLRTHYQVIWDEAQSHKFNSLAAQLDHIKHFKAQPT